MSPDVARLLRECAVDLVRASDLSDELALFRVDTVLNGLRELRAELDHGALHPALLRDYVTELVA